MRRHRRGGGQTAALVGGDDRCLTGADRAAEPPPLPVIEERRLRRDRGELGARFTWTERGGEGWH